MKRGKISGKKVSLKKKKKDNSKIYITIAIIIIVLAFLSFMPFFHAKTKATNSFELPSLNGVSFWAAVAQLSGPSSSSLTKTLTPIKTATISMTPGPSPSTNPTTTPTKTPTKTPTTTPTPIKCPGDIKPGDVCRSSKGVCDPAEICDSIGNCPADVIDKSEPLNDGSGRKTHMCRFSNGYPCDAAEYCDGTSPNCPADKLEPSTFLCRKADANGCNLDAYCTGSSDICPSNPTKPDGSSCITSNNKNGKCVGGVCVEVTDTCDTRYGVGNWVACPAGGDPTKLQCCGKEKDGSSLCSETKSNSVCCKPGEKPSSSWGTAICKPTEESCKDPTPQLCKGSTMNYCCPATSTCISYRGYAECGQKEKCGVGEIQCPSDDKFFKGGFMCCNNATQTCVEESAAWDYPFCEAKDGTVNPGYFFCGGTGKNSWRKVWCAVGTQFCETESNSGYPRCKNYA
jgi:hypothetical protein